MTMKRHVADSRAKATHDACQGNRKHSIVDIHCSAIVAVNDDIVAISIELLSARDPLAEETIGLPGRAIIDEILSVGCDVGASREDVVVVLFSISIYDTTEGA